MLKHPVQTKARFIRFGNELAARLYPESAPLKSLTTFAAPDRIPFAEAMKGRFVPAKMGAMLKPRWSTHWFKVSYQIPRAWKDREVMLYFDTSSEACVWSADGVPLQGLTGYNWGKEGFRSYFRLTSKARGGETGVLYVESAVNGLFGFDPKFIPPEDLTGTLRKAELVTRDGAVWDLLWDFMVIKEMAEHLPEKSLHFGQALRAANDIANAVVIGDNSSYPAGRAIARKFFAAKNGGRTHEVSAIGHAHIDTAWLWPLAESRRKCYRTFSTALRVMEKYPEYKFSCSQAQQWAWMKEMHPRLYAQMKAKAKAGQFIPVGGTWIEPDCNIPSGESLVRQFLVGQRFFRKELGVTCREFWNPDVFGYAGALPQIMRGAGIEFFLTQKLSWNQFNRPTSSTFLWEGIDGSRVLTHFPPSDTYNGVATVEDIVKHDTNFKDNDRASESALVYGYGDGGGGPTEEMLERIRRMKDVAGLPKVTTRGPAEFFPRFKENIVDPLVWSGELYFELHRGTYTTHSECKRDNRRSEEALHDVELFAALAGQTKNARYPHRELDAIWKLVLLNQFHDIIPGSSISEVYVDAARDYEQVLAATVKLRATALGKLLPETKGPRLTAFNTLSWPRREVVDLPGGKGRALLDAPAYGYAVAEPMKKTADPVRVEQTDLGFTLENGLVFARFDTNAHLVSFIDKRHGNREIVPTATRGNQFVLFEDKPALYDAWDMDVYHLEKRKSVGVAKSLKIVERGPLRGKVRAEIVVNAYCTMTLWISLDAESPRLDFEADADWRETDQFLKVEFPLALRSDHATYEIQFGHVRRPTHFNTTWDFARFEVCAHRWADLSEPNYGVALLNDSKYGYACHGNVLRLSLLRSPKSPDPLADMGRHHFRYALYPHEGGPQTGGVIPAAAAFNQPLRAQATSLPAQSRSYFSVDNPGVVLDTVKKAEDSDDLILRFYESHGAHQEATLTIDGSIVRAARVNLLEEGDTPIRSAANHIKLKLRPFEIVSLKVNVEIER
jgi:alpha-mannosidase